MDNQESAQAWDKAKVTAFAEIWQSEIGQEYAENLKQSRDNYIKSAMLPGKTQEQIVADVKTAYGIDLVVQDIELCKRLADQFKKESEAAKKANKGK